MCGVAVQPARIPVALLRWVLADAYADQAEMERLVAASDLDWTIARLNRLLDEPARGGVQISTRLLDKPRAITRSDVASALLDLAETTRYARAAVNMCGAW